MALAKVLKIAHSTRDEVENIGDKVQVVVIDGARYKSNQSPECYSHYSFRWQGGKSVRDGNKINYPTDSE